MFSTQSLKPNIKRELVEVDNDIVEILPRRAAAPNGNGFSVKIRDTSELAMADIEYIKHFLQLPSVTPTMAARFSMKEVSNAGGWEINIEDTSTLTFTHMQSLINIIDREPVVQSKLVFFVITHTSRERELRNRPQNQPMPPQQQNPVGPRVQPQWQQAPDHHQNPSGNAGPRPPVNLADIRGIARKAAEGEGPECSEATAYFLWLKETRQKFTKPGMRVSEVTKAVGIARAAMNE